MSSAKTQKAILRYLKSIGVWCFAFKTSICKHRRVPNILCCYKGKNIGLDVKTARGKPCGTQNAKSQRVNAASRKRKVVSSVEDVKDVLKELESSEDDQGDP